MVSAKTLSLTIAASAACLCGALSDPSPARAETLAGSWSGSIEHASSTDQIELQLDATEGGAWTGALSIPASDFSAPVSELSVGATEATFTVPGIWGIGASFAVTLDAEGLTGFAEYVPPAPPSTDVYLVTLQEGGWGHEVAAVENLTDRDGYDNQPYFLPDGSAVLYTSQRGDQTDIYRYDLASGETSQMTDTPESEYSPTPIPGAAAFATVRGTEQDLWSFPLDGGEPSLLLGELPQIGYFAFLDPETVAVFVLGDTFTLQIAELGAGTSRVVAEDIGRGLRLTPDKKHLTWIHKKAEGDWKIMLLDRESGESRPWAETPVGSEDLAWFPDGRLLMGEGSSLVVRDDASVLWEELVSLADHGITSISRVAIHPDGMRLAVVGERPSDQEPESQRAAVRLERATP